LRTLGGVAAAVVLVAVLAGGSASRAAHAPPPCASVVDALAGSSNFAASTEAFRAAGMTGVLAGAGPFTVFAPDQAAFKKVPASQWRFALRHHDIIVGIVTYHIVRGVAMPPAQLARVQVLKTLNGRLLAVNVRDGGVVLDATAKVLGVGTTCANGIVYEIDTVLTP